MKFWIIVGLFIISILELSAKTNSLLYSGDIRNSFTYFKNGEFKPLVGITKIWHETEDGHRRFISDILIDSTNSSEKYLQSVPIFNTDHNRIEIADQDSADCFLKKFVIHQQEETVYLFLITRAKGFPYPQYLPSFQKIETYVLKEDATQKYFIKISEKQSNKKMCSDEEIKSVTREIIDNTITTK